VGTRCKKWVIGAKRGYSVKKVGTRCKMWVIDAKRGYSVQNAHTRCKTWVLGPKRPYPVKKAHTRCKTPTQDPKNPYMVQNLVGPTPPDPCPGHPASQSDPGRAPRRKKENPRTNPEKPPRASPDRVSPSPAMAAAGRDHARTWQALAETTPGHGRRWPRACTDKAGAGRELARTRQALAESLHGHGRRWPRPRTDMAGAGRELARTWQALAESWHGHGRRWPRARPAMAGAGRELARTWQALAETMHGHGRHTPVHARDPRVRVPAPVRARDREPCPGCISAEAQDASGCIRMQRWTCPKFRKHPAMGQLPFPLIFARKDGVPN